HAHHPPFTGLNQESRGCVGTAWPVSFVEFAGRLHLRHLDAPQPQLLAVDDELPATLHDSFPEMDLLQLGSDQREDQKQPQRDRNQLTEKHWPGPSAFARHATLGWHSRGSGAGANSGLYCRRVLRSKRRW